MRLALVLAALFTAVPASAATPPSATLAIDLRDTPRGLFHAVETLPASPGPLVLALPRWIPGEHGPTGPIGDVAGLSFEVTDAAGAVRAVPWTRDPLDLFAFRLDLPAGTASLTARFDYLAAGSNGEYIDGPCTTANLALLSWNHVVLAPRDASQREFTVTPAVTLPAGWRYGTALAVASEAGADVRFAPVTLERLVDSPLSCGRFTRTVALAPGLVPPHRAFLVADSERALAAPADLVSEWNRVVREAQAALGAPHYASYTFLVTLSDAIGHFGLEHHESSDNRLPERALIEHDARLANATLLSHEFTHSWNGKHRRPADMDPRDFQVPVRTDLLWVYEGLTEYYGWLVAARAGALDSSAARDDLARTAAGLDTKPGRRWRPLIDTAVAAPLLNTAPGAWSAWRRSQDYYGEGLLIWLEADAKIRALTAGKKSLDTFARAFFGGEAGPPTVVPYTRADLVAALSAVAPFDWEGFFAARVDSVTPRAPLGGVEALGWRLAYRDSSSAYLDALDADDEQVDLRFSLGMRVGKDGGVLDVLPDSPAARAGLAPGDRLIAVDGRVYDKTALMDALDATRPAEPDPAKALAAGPRGRSAIEVVARRGDFVETRSIAWNLGPRFPALERRPGTPDGLPGLLRPLAAPARKR